MLHKFWSTFFKGDFRKYGKQVFTDYYAELRALVPIGDIAALMVKTAAALPRFELPMNLSHVSIQAPPVMGTTSTASTATRTRTTTTTRAMAWEKMWKLKTSRRRTIVRRTTTIQDSTLPTTEKISKKKHRNEYEKIHISHQEQAATSRQANTFLHHYEHLRQAMQSLQHD